MESNSVNSSEISNRFAGKVASTLLELSVDLKFLFTEQINCDLALRVGGRTIMCHKAILGARSRWFAKEIDKYHSGATSTIIVDENEQILDALLVFMYTGNLRLVESLNVPLLDLWIAATQYGMDRLRKILTRMIKSEEKPGQKKIFEFQCKFNFIDRKFDFDTTPLVLQGFSMDGTEWCLKLCTDFGEDEYDFLVYITRIPRTVNEDIIHMVKLDLNFMDSSGNMLKSLAKHYIFKNACESRMSEHISLCKPEEDPDEVALLPDGDLSFTGQVTVAAEDSTSSQRMLFQVKSDHETGVTNELHALSHDMHMLLKDAKYTDMKICKIKVHSYILFARSLIPIHLMQSFSGSSGTGRIVCKSFIHYMYTGQPRYLEEHMFDIYTSVCKLQLPESKQKYSRILVNNLTHLNVYYILFEAYKYDDPELELAAIYFIAHNDLIDQLTLTRLASRNSIWTDEIAKATRHRQLENVTV